MSFILDALKRAERDRRLEKAPDLSAVYEEDPPRHRKTWIWGIVSGAVLLGGVLTVFVLWPVPHTKEEKTGALNGKQRMAAAVKQNAPKPAGHGPDKKTESKDAGREQTQPAAPSAAKPVEKTVASISPHTDQTSKPALKPDLKRTETKSEPATKVPASSPDGIEPDKMVPGQETGDSDTVSEPPQEPEPKEVADAFEEEPPPPSSPPPVKSAKKAEPADRKPVPLVSQLPDDVKEPLKDLRINVHVYSEDPEERLVFINMRNRQVGDRIGETGPILKEITPDGVIIDYGDGVALLKVGK